MSVGERVVERRTALGMNQRDLARAADVTATTVRSLEQDRRWPQDVNRAKIEQALGWAPGSLEAIRDGGEPTTVTDDFANQIVRDLKPGDMARFSKRVSEAVAPVAIYSEGLRAAVDQLIPKIDVSSFIPKDSLQALSEVSLPSSVVQNIRRAAEHAASDLLPDFIELLTVEQRARLTYEILDILEEQGVDIDELLLEHDRRGPAPVLALTADDKVWVQGLHDTWAVLNVMKQEPDRRITIGKNSAYLDEPMIVKRYGAMTPISPAIVNQLLDEYGTKTVSRDVILDAVQQPDDLAARRDSNIGGRSIRGVVDDDDPTAGIDWRDYAAHPQTDPLEEDNPTP